MLASLLQNKLCLAILLALGFYAGQNTGASENEGNSTGPPSVENYVEYYSYVATEELDSFDRKILDSCNNRTRGLKFFDGPTMSELIATRLAFNQVQAAIRNETKENYTELDNISNAVMRQKLFYLLRRGPSNMDSEKLEQMIEIGSNMENAYRSTQICRYDGNKESSNCAKISVNRPDLLTEGAALSPNDFEKLEYYWTVRQDAIATATPIETYKNFTDLLNEHARASGYDGAEEVWTAAYNDGNRSISLGDFKEQMYSISAELKPFYEKLHAYVRMKLRNSRYGNHVSQFIPANLLGSVNSGNWDSLTAFTMPFNSEGNPREPDSNDRVIADDRFWTGISCWGPRFCYERATEFRQKTCRDSFDDEERLQDPTKYVSDSIIWHGSYLLQAGLNLGFHHAVADSRTLAFNYRKYMNCKAGIKFPSYVYCSKKPKEAAPNSTANLNYLYRTALYKFVPLVHTIAVLDWKLGVLNGTISPEKYNSRWWESLRQYQGIVPPTDRSNSSGLEAAGDLAIASNIEQSHEFIRQVLTFQLFQALCNDSGQYNIDDASSEPLHQCNLIEGDDEFERLGMLGMSRPYSDVLNELTGTNRLSAQPIINYLKPLFTFLDEELAKAGENPGFLEGPAVQPPADQMSQNVSKTSGADSKSYTGSESDGDVGMLGGLQKFFSMLRAVMM